ncbi:MAG: hypothetical protein ACREIN_01370 [Candidatus Methylomirabilaceae bacterium]
MIMKSACLLVAAMVAVALATSPAFGCDLAGPSTHIGKIKSIELAQERLVIVDMQTKKDFTFEAEPGQLQGLSLGQLVAVKYSQENGRLKAELITPR